MFLISAGKYSKSLSPRYKALNVSEKRKKNSQQVERHLHKIFYLTEFEEISGQNIFIQIVVRQIQNL